MKICWGLFDRCFHDFWVFFINLWVNFYDLLTDCLWCLGVFFMISAWFFMIFDWFFLISAWFFIIDKFFFIMFEWFVHDFWQFSGKVKKNSQSRSRRHRKVSGSIYHTLWPHVETSRTPSDPNPKNSWKIIIIIIIITIPY